MSVSTPPNFPAFPAHDYIVGDIQRDGFQKLGHTRGMTLRDYFAAKALTGLMNDGWQVDGNPFSGDKANRTAQIAYEFADAMLKAREAK